MSITNGLLGSAYYTAIQCVIDDSRNVSKDTLIIGFGGGVLGGHILSKYLPFPLLGPLYGVLLFDFLLFL